MGGAFSSDGHQYSVPVCFPAAELGDLNPLLQRENYISHFHLIPNQTSELEHEAEENHEKLRCVQTYNVIIFLCFVHVCLLILFSMLNSVAHYC